MKTSYCPQFPLDIPPYRHYKTADLSCFPKIIIAKTSLYVSVYIIDTFSVKNGRTMFKKNSFVYGNKL